MAVRAPFIYNTRVANTNRWGHDEHETFQKQEDAPMLHHSSEGYTPSFAKLEGQARSTVFKRDHALSQHDQRKPISGSLNYLVLTDRKYHSKSESLPPLARLWRCCQLRKASAQGA